MRILESANAFLWSVPLLILILCAGFGLTVATDFYQLRMLPRALKLLLQSLTKNKDTRDGTPAYRALCTALGATVGTGNLAGVAGAITIGGPGAIFWMWISGFFGMIIKFSEVVLAVQYREKDNHGSWIGGPMYTIRNALPKKFQCLGYIYCFFGVVAVFGVGNTVQVNTMLNSMESVLSTRFGSTAKMIIGILLAGFVFYAFRDGSGRIGSLCEMFVPIAASIYIVLGVFLLVFRYQAIPLALKSIILGAFDPDAVTGGLVGTAFITLRTGTARGVFTNEAGMGTASIAHAEANTTDPVRQGLLGITEVFIDTIVICTLTALVILCSGVPVPYGTEVGITLTLDAFSAVFGAWSSSIVSLVTCMLSLATILGWGLYGARCAQFLFGSNIWKRFAAIEAIAVLVGVIMDTSAVWLLSEFVNGLMAIPNMISLIYLSPQLMQIIKAYRGESCTL